MTVSWNDDTVLVTGGAGFIGSHLTERLVSEGADVVVADDLSRGKMKNIEDVRDQIEFRQVDLMTREGCLLAVEGVDHVFHLAASVGGIHFIDSENVRGLTPSVLMTTFMLEAARFHEVDRFLFASSACVYRQTHDGLNKFTEDQAIPADPHTTYGWAKILGEVTCDAYHDDFDVKTNSVRIFNAYGPRESLDPETSHVIPSLCRKVIETDDGGSITLFGDGTQERGFVHVEDLVEGLIRTMERKMDGDSVNLGNASEVVSMNELARTIVDISGKSLTIEHDRSKPTGTDKYAADTTKMRDNIGWEATVPLDDGLREVYAWAKEELSDEGRSTATEVETI